MQDVEGVLRVDEIVEREGGRIDVGLRIAGDVPMRVWLMRGDEHEPASTIIDGLVYIEQAPLDAYVEVMAVIGGQLGARWLHLADEDDDRLLLGDGLRLPSVCGVYDPSLIDPIVEPLRAGGATFGEVRGRRVVWTEGLAELAILRDHLAHADV